MRLVNIADVKEGDTLYPDGGFDCMSFNEAVPVHKGFRGLYVACAQGQHYLDGQCDPHGNCIGLSRQKWGTP